MAKVFPDVACTRCGCVCDDLTLHVDNDRVVAAERACSLSEPWLLQQASQPEKPTLVDGKSVTFEQAVQAAATILCRSRAPLICGQSASSLAAQRSAIALAEAVGATLDASSSACQVAATLAMQQVGQSTATLGEVRHRADLVIFWGCDPITTHPRLLERVVEASGQFVSGRSERHIVVVDIKRTATAELADTFLQVEPGGDFELLWALRAAAKGVSLRVDSAGGLSLGDINALADRLKSCHYGAVFFGPGLTAHPAPRASVEGLLRLVTELNAHTRFVALPLATVGTDSVLTWQTGFPLAVNLARGYPRYSPSEYAANTLLERGEVNAVVFVGTENVAKLSEAAQEALTQLPVIALESPSEKGLLAAAVQFRTAVAGVHCDGTAFRMDKLSIPLRAVLNSPVPSDAEVLDAITQECLREGQD